MQADARVAIDINVGTAPGLIQEIEIFDLSITQIHLCEKVNKIDG